MTNDIEILKKLSEIKQSLLEVNQAIGKLSDLALLNSKQLIEDVICPPDFPAGKCDGCGYPKSKCVCNDR